MFKLFKRSLCTDRIVTYLKSQKSVELKSIAVKSGVLSSGTKIEVIDRLVHHFSNQIRPSQTILSFDVGYRNLAYCVLDKDKTVIDWARVDLELPSFHPSVMAPVLRQFIHSIQHHVRNVDHILIERQRARSGGGHAVFEVTLRVNCVEAMLWYGLFEIAGGTNMIPISRQIIDRNWQTQLEDIISISPRLQSLQSKTARKKKATALLVRSWLESDKMIDCPEELKNRFYKEKKQDDMSDCLVQALTWYQWEKYSIDFIHDNDNNSSNNKN